MATSYTTSLRLPVPQPLDPATTGQWGPLIDAAITLTDQAVAGVANVAVTTNPQTLTTANGASDQARPTLQVYTGTLGTNTTINLPNVSKIGWAQNLTVGGFSIVESAGAGTTATIPPDGFYWLRVTDGATNAAVVNLGVNSLNTQGPATFGGKVNVSGVGVAVQILNSANYGATDSGGTPRAIIGLGSDNNTYITNGGGQSIKFRNQAQTFTRLSITDAGTISAGGNSGDRSTISLAPTGNAVTVNSVPSPPANFSCFVGNLASTGSFYGFWEFGGTNVGSISPSASGVSYNTTSDGTLKIDDGILGDVGRIIDRLRPRWFRWKSAPDEEAQPGFFAQQVHHVFPWAVTKGRGRKGSKNFIPWQMDNAKLMPVVIAELQSLRRRVRELERCLSDRGS